MSRDALQSLVRLLGDALASEHERAGIRQHLVQADVNLAVKDAGQQAGEAAASARSKWAQMEADAAARIDDFQAKVDRRADPLDAKTAGS